MQRGDRQLLKSLCPALLDLKACGAKMSKEFDNQTGKEEEKVVAGRGDNKVTETLAGDS